MIEREIKLRYSHPQEARTAILAVGAAPLRSRRLQDDYLLDTPDDLFRGRGSALRVRLEAGTSVLTFKGPVQPALAKLREELETTVGDGLLLLHMLDAMGFRVWFRCQKYREEFALDGVTVAIDETPFGTFVEIEGSDRGIAEVAAALGCGPDDYVLDSYRGLFSEHCRQRGLPVTDMLFDHDR